jgi:16S rRNA (cytidine1402-2'-O)-methyltransferase
MGKLYICATPIGNLEDITLRALRVLKEVDVIAAEDTRHTKVLLNKYGISTPLTSYHKFNVKAKTKSIINSMKSGKLVALVSDAGMPGISDPGYELVRESVEAGVEVVPVPGPNAAVAALASSGLPTDRFAFEGFLPAKAMERRGLLEKLRGDDRTLIFYEAPHRLLETLEEIREVFGDRRAAVGREITKKFEEFTRGTLDDLIGVFKSKKPRGEFVLMLEGGGAGERGVKDELLLALIKDLLKLGISKKDAAKIVSKYSGLTRNQAYDMVLKS